MNDTTNTNAATPEVSLDNLPSIASAAMIGTLNISVWEGRKKDKGTEQELNIQKQARSSKAASVHKHLLPEAPALEAIKTMRGKARAWFNTRTLPWSDNGGRLITTAQYFEVLQEAQSYEQEFNKLVQVFLNTYSTEISKQAFELGAFFDRSDYPTVDELRGKFRFVLSLDPVPLADDFRVNIGNEALKQLRDRCMADTQTRLATAMADAWNRVKEQVEWVHGRMSAVLEYDPDAVEEIKETDEQGNVVSVAIKKKRRPKLHESMLDQGMELCSLLRDLNITNDPKLEEARQMLEKALVHVDIDSLKESKETQESTLNAMQSIIDKFDF